MPRLRNGFTLLEVLIALLVITIGVLGVAGTLGPISKLAARGKASGRAAFWLESRMDLLRAELRLSGSACSPPVSGSAVHPDGVAEAWNSTSVGGLVELRMTAGLAGVAETLVSRLSCP
jgi:prepilin-type N-terminal cleavage/methylation domain-containing protein